MRVVTGSKQKKNVSLPLPSCSRDGGAALPILMLLVRVGIDACG